MASRYDKATPAKDTYFNTFVPLPLEQLTALGMSRKQDLEKNQMLLDRAYENAVNIKYAKESPFEETHYRNIVSGVTELAQKYASVDLTNPLEINNMRRELRTVADPALIKNMEATWAANEQKKALVADLKANGRWNEYLDDDPITSHNSATGSYNWLPEAYMGRKALFGPYFDNLPVDYKGIDNKTNMMVHGVRGEDINRIANERAAELASTPGGQQEIKIYKASHKPSDYEGKTNEQILNIVARDYGEKEIHDVYSALPEYMVKARAGKGLAAPSSLPLVTMSGATDTSEGYKKDLVKSKELQTGITKLDKEIESTEDPNLKTQFGAMKSELVNERNRIEKVAAQVRADAIPEYTAAKSKIMDQFYRESKVMGLDKTAADAVFKDISNEGDSLSWFNKRLQSVFNQSSEGLNTFAKTERARIAEGPLEIAKGPGYLWYKGLIAATKNDPNVSDEQRAEYQRRADEWGLKGRGDSDEFAQERIAVDAYRALEKLDRRTDRKVASKYDDKSYKNEQDLGFVLPGAEVSSSSNDLTTTKDGLQKIRATSALLKNFKTRGGQDYNVIDVSPVDKERDYLTKTKDIKNFILQADNVTLGTIAPASKTDGTYSFTVTATKDLGTDKGVEIKNFKVSANEFSGPEAGSWKAAIYDDLMDQGHQAEAYRIVDSRLETEIIAKQNDKEIVIAPDRSNADVKFRFANNLDGTYDQVNTKTGEVIPSNAGLELQEIIQLLYDYKVALLKK